ncbi:MAG: hypothetical protein HN396_16850 [Gemmatimonadales bacterium]|nr:hypothetical protein [Gemmatimonadales bacterium]
MTTVDAVEVMGVEHRDHVLDVSTARAGLPWSHKARMGGRFIRDWYTPDSEAEVPEVDIYA